MRFHVMGLPWTVTSKEYCDCAYTQKVLNFCKMMTLKGHETIHYGAEGATVHGQHVTTLTKAEQVGFFGERDKDKLGSPTWNPNDPHWLQFNAANCDAIARRIKPNDFICHITGASRTVARYFAEFPRFDVEYGIGYSGVFAEHRAFESHSIKDAIWHHHNWEPDGNNNDWVIPNYYDVDDFPVGTGGDYLLFVGRIVRRKGLAIAMDVAKHLGMKLIIAGQGAKRVGDSLVSSEMTPQGPVVYRGGDWDYVGHVDVERRAELMGGARAILVPSYYTEPFGGVNVEAQLCGTPAITQDWGGFVETVEHGKSGYRCKSHNLDHWAWAVANAGKLDRRYIRERAIRKYSLEKVGDMFEEFFQSILDRHKGWNAVHADRDNLDWLAA